jgi:hypothetical protein
MKKIIAATAGLMLVGGMVTAASAEVTFTGDARERLVMQEKYNSNKNQEDFGYGRVRLLINATTKGGAFANVRMIFGNNEAWSDLGTPPGTGLGTGSAQSTATRGNGENILNYATDWAYMGIPIGPVTVLAGRMPDFSDIWFRFDKRVDGVAATWANKMTSVTFMADKIYESSQYPTQTASFSNDPDVNQFALILKQKFAADWDLLGYVVYQDAQENGPIAGATGGAAVVPSGTNVDGSGFKGTVKVTGPAGPVKLLAELSAIQSDLAMWSNPTGAGITNGTRFGSAAINPTTKYSEQNIAPIYHNGKIDFENGYGGIFHAKMDFGPAAGTFVTGFTHGGFQADANYGFLMIGGGMGGVNPDLPGVGSPITAISRIGQNPVNASFSSNTWFAGLIGDYQVNKMIKLVGILADANVSDYGNLVEVSGLANFAITDGAYINVGGGLLFKSLTSKLNTLNGDAATYTASTGVSSAAVLTPSTALYGPGQSFKSTHDDMAFGVFTELGIKF